MGCGKPVIWREPLRGAFDPAASVPVGKEGKEARREDMRSGVHLCQRSGETDKKNSAPINIILCKTS